MKKEVICISTSKLLIITWVVIALLIGIGVGYLLGVNGVGQKAQSPVQPLQQQNFGPGSGSQAPQLLNQGEAPAGAPGGRNPVPNVSGQPASPNRGEQPLPQQGGQQGQSVYPNQPQR